MRWHTYSWYNRSILRNMYMVLGYMFGYGHEIHGKAVTNDELRAALDTLGWNPTRLARELDCDWTTPWRWTRGEQPVPPGVAAWLRPLAREYARLRARYPVPTNWRTGNRVRARK